MSSRTIRAALEDSIQRLGPVHQSARLDAEVLLGHVLGTPRHRPYAFPEEPIRASDLAAYEDLVERRAAGEPVAYLIGEREFWSITLEVTPATLIPRPETEQLVEIALANIPRKANWCVADLGTGSGALAIAIATERPRCRLIATDISTPALEVARRNAARTGLSQIEFRLGSWCEALGPERCHLLVANPPYVASSDPHLGRSDVRFEPRIALSSGADGLNAIRTIVAQAPRSLEPGAKLVIEHGWDQAGAVEEILRAAGAGKIQRHQDLAGHDRLTEARWPPQTRHPGS